MEETKKCAYCGKERPVSEMCQGKITYIGSRWNGFEWAKGVVTDENWYCADSHCHGYDQMAHEG
jgi:hypothetical protein